MPVGRHRKPFSTKQKKEQLQAKRELKRNKERSTSSSPNRSQSNKRDTTEQEAVRLHEAVQTNKETQFDKIIRKLNEQPVGASSSNADRRNRFNLYFLRESKEELMERKKDSFKPLNKISSESELEIDINEIYKPNTVLDIPIRPEWKYGMSKEVLEINEKNYFRSYLEKIFESYKLENLSYFEMNLETWRQLWRVTEISDIILYIVDVRYPVLHFSPIFYNYVTKTLKKELIFVLNKIDLVPNELVIAWKHYFQTRFPQLHIITFTSQPKYSRAMSKMKIKNQLIDSGGTAKDFKRQSYDEDEAEFKRRKQLITLYSHHTLYDCVKAIVSKHYSQINIDNWYELIKQYQTNTDANITDLINLNTLMLKDEVNSACAASIEHDDLDVNKKFVTIGCCGFPNVGKSSLLNSLFGKKVVSVSRTPGHTKHLQTLYLTNTIRLCDCPGIVFPSLVCKPLQILSGIFPIAQLQEPYSTIRYLSERIPIIELLGLQHPRADEAKIEWSPIDICEAWAIKIRYYTAKAARPDTYRAANELLRMSIDGRLCLALRPINYANEYDKWRNDSETLALKELLKKHGYEDVSNKKIDLESIDEDDDEEVDDSDEAKVNEQVKSSNEDASDEEEASGEEQSVNRYNLLSNLADE